MGVNMIKKQKIILSIVSVIIIQLIVQFIFIEQFIEIGNSVKTRYNTFKNHQGFNTYFIENHEIDNTSYLDVFESDKIYSYIMTNNSYVEDKDGNHYYNIIYFIGDIQNFDIESKESPTVYIGHGVNYLKVDEKFKLKIDNSHDEFLESINWTFLKVDFKLPKDFSLPNGSGGINLDNFIIVNLNFEQYTKFNNNIVDFFELASNMYTVDSIKDDINNLNNELNNFGFANIPTNYRHYDYFINMISFNIFYIYTQ